MLNKDAPTPVYYQLKKLIRRKIESGEWRVGDLIPSERELCEQHGISRMTVRRALGDLVHEGLLRREQGKGTFIAEPKITQHLRQLTSFTQEMRARHKIPGAKVLQLQFQPASPIVAEALQVEPDQSVIVAERLRLADGEPMAVETCHLHFEGCEELVNEDLTKSLYRLLRQKYGIIPTRAEQQMEAGYCPSGKADLLAVPAGMPVLLNQRTTYDQHDQAFEYVESVYRGDRYTFHVELTV